MSAVVQSSNGVSIKVSEDYGRTDSITNFYGTEKTVSSMLHDSNGGPQSANKLGTLMGVYLPCCQNILGVILFIRLPWIVGQAGIIQTCAIIIICVVATILTTLSMSALATNGRIPPGGPYAIVTRNLGPEFGGAVGLLFYLGTTIAVTMYALGGVEALITNFGLPEFTFQMQIIGIGSTLLLGGIVLAGMSFVAKIGPLFLAVVIMAVMMMTIGVIAFQAGGWDPDADPPIYHNTDGENVHPNFTVDESTGRIPSFNSLIALFFPSVTGIMAGSNRSGVLLDPGRAIPKGTLWAIVTTTSVYLITVILFGTGVANITLKENKLVASSIAWPHSIPVGVGIVMSCVGAGLQSLAGAPQLLKSIANDGHIKFLRVFKTKTDDEEPKRAVVFTTLLAATCCLAGNLDYITPIITMFFLSMYGSINLACFLASFMKSPGFRPTWRYYHWLTAALGFLWCVVVMLVISWIYAIVAFVFVSFLYLYIRGRREKKEWGSVMVGIRLEQAISALFALSEITHYKAKKRQKRLGRFTSSHRPQENEQNDTNSLTQPLDEDALVVDTCTHLTGSNWRPQVLVLVKLDRFLNVTQPDLLKISAQLKKGRGLFIACSMIHGNLMDPAVGNRKRAATASLASQLRLAGVRGFADVVIGAGSNLLEPLRVLIQSQGLGLLAPNTVMVAWPTTWRDEDESLSSPSSSSQKGELLSPQNQDGSTVEKKDSNPESATLSSDDDDDVNKTLLEDDEDDADDGGNSVKHKELYTDLLKSCIGCGKAVVVSKGVFPESHERLKGTIDVWWLIHDGGILVLLPYLIQRHKVWKGCTMRIFMVTPVSVTDPSVMREKLLAYLMELRIVAQVEIVSLRDRDVRDLDENRTVVIRNGVKTPSGHASVLDIFSHDTAEDEGRFAQLNAGEDAEISVSMSSPSTSPRLASHGKASFDFSDNQTKKLEQLSRQIESQTKDSSESMNRWKQEYKGRGRALSTVFEKELIEDLEQMIPFEDDEAINSCGEDSEDQDSEERAVQHKKTFQDEKDALILSAMEGGTRKQPEDMAKSKGGMQQEPTECRQSTTRRRSSLKPPPVISSNLEDSFKATSVRVLETDETKVARRREAGLRLNRKILEKSRDAQLVVLNLPLSRKMPTEEFVQYTSALVKDLPRVLMIRGSGREVVTNFA